MASHSDMQPAIIAIMGSTGVGKSSFINTVTKNHRLPVGHALDSCTKEIQEVRLKWGEKQKPVVLVDTPGFNDSSMSDTEVLRLIAKYLVTTHKAGTKLTGVIYMHRIADSKVEGGTRRNFRMFQQLCGSKHLRQVVIVTTWWDKVDGIVALARERQLCEGETLFRPMLAAGAKMMRHEMRLDEGFSSAQAVLNHLLQLNPTDLNIQTQLVKEKRSLPVTDAGSVINHDLIRDARRCLDSLAAVQEELDKTKDATAKQTLEEERRELQEEKKAIRKQIKTLSKNLNERFVLWRILSSMGL
ncbi:P-loop containing nucleoside triphosphate hydrolase protein [Rickenella mellea]|uniref:P-loop containing nucleoside triphosphate hydrolase protein n=1 Tax=Rickenella mellea TaxID=50990 RepID=A0A4Y7PJ12_9AGAM|nr:P-loop containing nucleoside triphosphate hydrolase protein [Rickenella mellea]